MFTLKIENKNNQVLELTNNESNYQIVNIDGLNPPKADLYTKAIANMDGERFKSSKLQMRNIVLTIKINGNVEDNRLFLYGYFGSGKWCKIYYKNQNRSVYIEGYCENIECDLFTLNQQMQISIICPDPYFKSLRALYADISQILGNFEFPFAIEKEGIEFSIYNINDIAKIIYSGEIEAGIIIKLTAVNGSVTNPKIYNLNDNNFILLNIVMNEGDTIIINTNKGHKSVIKISNAVETNIINALDVTSSWLKMVKGENYYTYDASVNPENLKIEFESNILYEGL